MPTSAFERLWNLGYHRLVPVIPPDAEISDRSSLFKRVGTRQDGRGKTPGIKGHDGKWFGFDWVPYEADDKDLTRWATMGAGVGIKTGEGLVAIDADTKDEQHARTIKDSIAERLGVMPIRIGNYPKAIYVCRVDGPFQYSRIEFGAERVEVLSGRKQFVAEGIHPATNQPYRWAQELVPYDELPTFRPEQITDLLKALAAALPAASEVIREGGDSNTSQAALKGPLAEIRRAVQSIPNTSEHFPSREAYRDMGYAIKAALPEHPSVAFELFADWCANWQDGDNDPEIVEADWRRMKPPYRRGASWLYETAERISPNRFSVASAWFEPITEQQSIFPREELPNQFEAEAAKIRATPYPFPDISAIPPREWIYGTHYIRKFVSATVAPSGVGKSSLEIVEALAMASGKPLLNIVPKGQFRVWLWNGEDPMDELQRRVAAAMLHYGLTREDIDDRLFLDTGREMEIVLATETREGTRIAAPVAAAIMETIVANRIDVFQVDPFVSSHRVSENDNGAIDLVSKQWARIANATNCAVDLVHHVRKLNGAEITVEDSRGAVALIATARSARALAKMQKGEASRLGIEKNFQRFFRFGDGKNNLALPASEKTEWMELVSVDLGNGPGSGVDALLSGDSVGVVACHKMPEASALADRTEQQVAFDLIRAGTWRRDIRAGDSWVGNPIAQALRIDLSDEADKARVKSIISSWIREGALKEVSRRDEKRMMKTFIEVAYEEHTGVFE